MNPADLVADATAALTAHADPEVGAGMAAYMKSSIPCLGVKKPQRVPIERQLARDHAPADQAAYEAAVLALWGQREREYRYLAIALARRWKRFVAAPSLPLYERLVQEGAWWDFVDEVAIHLIGRVWLLDRDVVGPWADARVDDEDMWLRRTAIIGQVAHKGETDAPRLFAYARARLHEREFFIRKAIGWALRAYSYVDADAVIAFVEAEQERMAGLTRREATKALARHGRWPPAT